MTDQERIELRDIIRDMPAGEGRAVYKEDMRSLNELRQWRDEKNSAPTFSNEERALGNKTLISDES
jgi:hypothetical protein